MPFAQSDAEWRISRANARRIAMAMFCFSCASRFLNQVAVALHKHFLSWSDRYLSRRHSSWSMLSWQVEVVREGELLATKNWMQLLQRTLSDVRNERKLINYSEAYRLRGRLGLPPWPGRGSPPWGTDSARAPSLDP